MNTYIYIQWDCQNSRWSEAVSKYGIQACEQAWRKGYIKHTDFEMCWSYA